jgi:hypothetical protein
LALVELELVELEFELVKSELAEIVPADSEKIDPVRPAKGRSLPEAQIAALEPALPLTISRIEAGCWEEFSASEHSAIC